MNNSRPMLCPVERIVGHADLDEIERMRKRAINAYDGDGDRMLYTELVECKLPLLIAELRAWRASSGRPNEGAKERELKRLEFMKSKKKITGAPERLPSAMSAWKCPSCGHEYDGPQRPCPKCSKPEHSFAAPPCSAAKRVRQETAEIPAGLEWCKVSALRLISMSDSRDFRDGDTWGKWCRSVAGAGLVQDPAKIAWLASDVGYYMPPNDEGQRRETLRTKLT